MPRVCGALPFGAGLDLHLLRAAAPAEPVRLTYTRCQLYSARLPTGALAPAFITSRPTSHLRSAFALMGCQRH